MSDQLIIALLGSSSSLIVAIVSVYMSNRLIGYKVDELEKKVEKHNNVVERVAILEKVTSESFATVWRRYDDMREYYDEMLKEVRSELRTRG
jgi:transcriptional regulator NrdR family protein